MTKGFGVEGAFKIPSLRNVALTAPYFHNGDVRTLREVVELYSRGGNVFPVQELDGTVIEPLGVPSLTSDEIDAIVAFLEALTDERVLYRRAPFDHPQIFVPNGHPEGTQSVTWTRTAMAWPTTMMVEIPAVGAAGRRSRCRASSRVCSGPEALFSGAVFSGAGSQVSHLFGLRGSSAISANQHRARHLC